MGDYAFSIRNSPNFFFFFPLLTDLGPLFVYYFPILENEWGAVATRVEMPRVKNTKYHTPPTVETGDLNEFISNPLLQ